MNAIYDICKLDTDGIRESVITRYGSFSAKLVRDGESQVTISGTCIGDVPLELGNRVALVRNGAQLFSGITTGLTVSCEDCQNNLKDWVAELSGDAVVLSWRYVFASSAGTAPSSIRVAEDVYDKIPNNNDETDTQPALDRMLYYIRKHAGPNAHSDRRLVTISDDDPDRSRGTEGRSAYHMKQLNEVIKEIGEPDELYPEVVTNSSGTRVLTIPGVRDRTDAVVVAPEFGNVAAWQCAKAYPEFNCVWVISGAYDDGAREARVWVYLEDESSVNRYGRIENVITKGDIKVVDETDEHPAVTVDEVRKLLEAEGRAQLEDAAAQDKWTVTMAETDSCRFMDDWRLGDRVKCVIDGSAFTSVIETVQIEYAAGFETVTPTIGEVEKGLYGDLYKMLYGIDRRLKTEEGK